MATSDELLIKLIESLAAEGLRRDGKRGLDEFEREAVEWVHAMRGRRKRDLEDVAIAQLIPHGVELVMERFGTSERHGFRRARRGRHLLKTTATIAIPIGS